jgi:predicted dehydrogenase
MSDRREFLKELGFVIGAGVISTAPWLDVLSESKTQKLKCKIAIIGTGSRGQLLMSFLVKNPKVDILAICDNYRPNLLKASELVPKAKVFTDYRKLLDEKDIEGVVIATPPAFHAKMTIDAFAAGKNVFCEKALSIHMDEVLSMYKAYRSSGKIFFIGQQRFFDPRYIQAISMLHSGNYGAIQSIRMNWDRNSDWRRPVPIPELERQINWRLYKATSKGLMTELACHQLGVGMWAMRSVPNKVMGVGSLIARGKEREVYDNVSCIYTFDNGVKMTYESTNSNKFYGMEESILCEKATFELEKSKYYYETIPPAPGLIQLLHDAENMTFNAIPLAGSSWIPEIASQNKGEYLLRKKTEGDGTKELLEAYAESVITRKQPKYIAEESYYSTQLCLLGHQAMEEERIVEFPDKYKINYLNHKKTVLFQCI